MTNKNIRIEWPDGRSGWVRDDDGNIASLPDEKADEAARNHPGPGKATAVPESDDE